MISFTPAPEEIGRRIDVVLAERGSVTRTLAQRAVKNGDVMVGGQVVRSSYRLEEGDQIEGSIPEPVFVAPEAEDIPITIRYRDERVIVVSKPPGLVTHPAAGHHTGTLVNSLLNMGEPLAAADSTRPGIVHRLDKDTSGLLLVAKDDLAQASLVESLRDRRISRRYLALVRGIPTSSTGSIDAPIGRHPTRRQQMAVVTGGRPSVTHYETLETGDGLALLEVSLETGRTHQIRVHLNNLGHPVMGDRTYGGVSDVSKGLGLDRPFLHAWRLAFPHPDDGRLIEVQDPLPPDLVGALGQAGLPIPR
ncbi:MAG: RluA family pseudouridine synthase [Actinobacteria bacterium]|nr:RluA family pseudouridine synthase [Actinomycetota bacterium]